MPELHIPERTLAPDMARLIEDFRESHPPIEPPEDFLGMCVFMPHYFKEEGEKRGIGAIDFGFFRGTGIGEHHVSIWHEYVIDWTVRQYSQHQAAPYPYIYLIGTRAFFECTVVRESTTAFSEYRFGKTYRLLLKKE